MAVSHLIHPSISALISSSLQLISSDEIQKLLTKHGKTSRLLNQLNKKLLSLNHFLADAEDKASSDDQSWLDDLKDVVYDAESTLDLIVVQASRLNSSSNSFKKVNLSFFSCIIPSDERIDSELMEILKKLDGIVKQESDLGQQVLRTRKLNMHKSREYVGRELVIKKLIDMMVKFDSEFINAVVVSGVSGVGKTAVAQMLYNDERLDAVFEMKSWLQFEKDFRVSDVFRGLYEELLGNVWCSDKETIEQKLCSFIKGKKLLLVFDDVCFERLDYLEEILQLINVGAKGTTVIFTTCNNNASSSSMKHLSVHLNPLSDTDCWSLIKSVAIDHEFALDEKIEAIGRNMSRKCKGLPLSAVVLGGVLRSIPQEISEWEAVSNSPGLNSSNNIIRLSYINLYNPELELCFAYCSLFPENYRFKREELVLLWMAEGFIVSENLGNTYFNELVSRSFFQQMGAKEETFFAMHNLVHDLAVSIFGSELDGSSRRRHLSFVQTKYHDSEKIKRLSNAKLRTFLAIPSISNEYFCYMPRLQLPDVFPRWSCMRVLSLPHYQISKIPTSVENLRQLRYLNLSFTRITNLPNSIRKLYKLQTLLLSNCSYLTELPMDLGHLISLRHLDIRGADSLQEMPIHISKLKNLEVLSKFALGTERGARISELCQLQSLKGSLMISGLENVDSLSSVKAANIKGKVFLNELVYQWHNHSRDQTRVLDELKPHVNLERLTIHGFYGTKFPNWVGAQANNKMVALNLSDCHSCVSLPPLGRMSSLKHLSIEGLVKVVEVGLEFYGKSDSNSSSFTPFPSLETLKFKEMCSWRKWSLFEGEGLPFPNLTELCLDFCPALQGELPTNLPLLSHLDIRYYPELTNSLQNLSSIKNLTLRRCSLPNLHIVTHLTSLSALKIDSPGNISSSTFPFSPSILNLEAKSCNFETLCYAPTWLTSLTLTQCQNLGLSSTDLYTNLRYLSIIQADSLTTFELNLFPNLIYLEISSCPNLKSFLLPQDHISKSLHDLSISNCHNLQSFPANGIPAPNLTRLTITGCNKMTPLPEKMCISMASLKLISIENCPQINTFPIGGLPQGLLTLKVSSCSKLISNRMNWQLQSLVFLKELEIGGDENVEEIVSFPDEQFLLPKSLTKLTINGFKNLKALNTEGLNVLTSLEELKICGCPKVESFPEDLMLPSLCSVDFSWSNVLVSRCRRNREDWHKISHLPRVRGGKGSEY